VWSKVFQGFDTPAQRINKLKEMLQDLGMKGRMSMEQAKAIREKREFAQELRRSSLLSSGTIAYFSYRGCPGV
jgi:outer membrane protein TolC